MAISVKYYALIIFNSLLAILGIVNLATLLFYESHLDNGKKDIDILGTIFNALFK